MKMTNKFLTGSAVALLLTAVLPSCSMEEPFADGGEGTLSLTTEINGDVKKTRAIGTDELTALREKCIVYISSNKGLVRKYKGLDNVPENITLRTGSYVAEAWSGDSVSASFDSKFYRGYQPFELAEGANSLTLRCNIANVLVSVDPESLKVNLKNLKVTFSHSRGSLEFTEENIPTAKGYFMMPNADKDLSYKIEGTKSDGGSYIKEGKIENVQRAHEYCMTISQDDTPITEGGALIKLEIADIPLIEEYVEIFPAPAIHGIEFDMAQQVTSVDRYFNDKKVYVRGYNGLSSIVMNVSDNCPNLTSGVNVLDGSVISDLNSKGISVEIRKSKDATADGGQVDVDEAYITFSKSFLDALPASESEYRFELEATDGNHKSSTAALRVANTDAAIEVMDPIGTVEAPDPETDPMAILASSAIVKGFIADETATGYGIMYREQGTFEWSKAYPTSSEAKAATRKAKATPGLTRADRVEYAVKLTGLKPGTTYEYRSFCDGFENSAVMTFATEEKFVIPGASFEEWSTYSAKTLLGTKNVVLPWPVGDKSASFWGSGNEGAATANKTLTTQTTDMIHSGSYAAKLASNSAVGVIAAGNVFIGEYVRTDGTNGVLSMGRPYNGSHPKAVRVYANYRPGGSVSVKKGNEQYIDDMVAGGTDQGQIYVALITEAQEIRTNPDDRKLFEPDGDYVLAYGQVTWKEAFGPDGRLQVIEIPFEYKEIAKTVRPKCLVITACASKFGDYFSGSASSVLYLDDFELIYE